MSNSPADPINLSYLTLEQPIRCSDQGVRLQSLVYHHQGPVEVKLGPSLQLLR